MKQRLTLIDGDIPFPAPANAMAEPNGLLAVGGDLSPNRLLDAYCHGIFPWYGPDDPILWWSPDPRAVFQVNDWQPNTSLKKALRKQQFDVSLNQQFDHVIEACARTPRPGQDGTWITRDIQSAYQRLFRRGSAFSIEVTANGQLFGGMYGVHIGRMVYGESMFSWQTNASKYALAALLFWMKQQALPLLDAQVANAHTTMLGATQMAREQFLGHVATLSVQTVSKECWQPRSLTPLLCGDSR